jgi:hypothetical protein
MRPKNNPPPYRISGLLGSNLGVSVRYAVFDLILDGIKAGLADKDHPMQGTRLKADMIDAFVTRNQKRTAN